MSAIGVIFGLAFLIVGIILTVFSRSIGDAADQDVERTLPKFLAELVRQAPLGIDMRRRVFVVGVGFAVFGVLFAAIDPFLS